MFGEADPTTYKPPCFGGTICLDYFPLNETEKQELKNVLYIIAHFFPHITFCTIIVSISAILAHHMDAQHVLNCAVAMMESKSTRDKSWNYFPLHSIDFLVFVRVFEDLVEKFCPKLFKHVQEMALYCNDSGPDWERLLSHFFVDLLPFPTVCGIMDSFVVEGYKIIHRFAIAILIQKENDLLATSSFQEFDAVLFRPLATDQVKLTKTAYGLKFSRKLVRRSKLRHRKASIGDFDHEDYIRIFHNPMPNVFGSSSILKDTDWINLWAWLPNRYQLFNPHKMYSSDEDGHYLVNLFLKTESAEPTIFLIEIDEGHIFGAFLTKSWKSAQSKLSSGTGETFLFSIAPETKHYKWDPEHKASSFMIRGKDYIAMGAGNGFGIWINNDMSKISSAPCDTFMNETLTPIKNRLYNVYKVEVYVLR